MNKRGLEIRDSKGNIVVINDQGLFIKKTSK